MSSQQAAIETEPGREPEVFRHPTEQIATYLAGATASGLAFVLLSYSSYLAALAHGAGRHPLGQGYSLAPLLVCSALTLIVLALFVWFGYLGIAGLVHRLLVRYEIDDAFIRKRSWRTSEEAAWSEVSSFSETASTHREGDQFCYLKGRDGRSLMRVGAHVIGREGPRLLSAIRQRLGRPTLVDSGAAERFCFGDFGNTPPYHLELTPEEIAAVSSAGDLRLPFEEIENIQLRSWPETGMGMERVRILAGDRLIDLDSRVIGFWPLMDFVADRAVAARVEDKSRRARLGDSLGRDGIRPG